MESMDAAYLTSAEEACWNPQGPLW